MVGSENNGNPRLIALFDTAGAALRSMGVVAGTYHLVPPFHSQVSDDLVIVQFGLPDGMAQDYIDSGVFADDPIPDFIVSEGRAMLASDATKLVPVSMRYRRYLAKWRKAFPHPLYLVPLYGPRGRDSISSFSLGRPFTKFDQHLSRHICEFLQSTHVEICDEVFAIWNRKIKLSKREEEILTWVARGKTGSETADILGISKATTDTYMKRIFEKLEVNDRVTAVVRGFGLGLVRL